MISEIKVITNVIESILKAIDEPLQISIECKYPTGYKIGRIKGEAFTINVFSDGSFNFEKVGAKDEDSQKTKWFI